MKNVEDKSIVDAAAFSPTDAEFARRARNLLLESTDHLDGRTLSRLTQARHAALDAVEAGSARSAFPTGRWLAPAGGLAAVAAVAIVWLGATRVDPVVQSTVSTGAAGAMQMEDLALVADAESLELVEEIEFYAWLDAEADLPSTAAGGVG